MAQRIRVLRKARGLNQSELAALCGVTVSAVSQWETGTTASIKLPVVMALTEALHTDLAFLVYGAARKPAAPQKRTGRTG